MNVLTSVLAVFTAMADWFAETIPTITDMFYNSTDGLTFLGTLSVAGLSISVVFLFLGLIQRFLNFRGN